MGFDPNWFVEMQAFRGTVDAFHVKTIDTTGAGDSFIGALLCKIVDDQSVLEVNSIINTLYNRILKLAMKTSFREFIYF